MKNLIPENFLATISKQAQDLYPEECCGFILSKESCQEYSRVYPCDNVQNKYHAKEPKSFPRTAKTAYFIDPKQLLELQKELRVQKEEIRMIYHSHIDAEAYFSEEDKKRALYQGEPLYPNVDYGVISVMKGYACEMVVYEWCPQASNFKVKSRHKF